MSKRRFDTEVITDRKLVGGSWFMKNVDYWKLMDYKKLIDKAGEEKRYRIISNGKLIFFKNSKV
jgi:hypothetical protein